MEAVIDSQKSVDEFNRLKKQIHQKLVSRLNLARINTMDDFEIRRELRLGINELLRNERNLVTKEEREQLCEEIIDETLGLGPIESLMSDSTVSDVLINGPSNVYVERKGKLEKTNVRFHDNEHLIEIIKRVASRMGRRLDESCPMVDARMSNGSRVNAVINPLAIDGALVSIRLFPASPLEASDLITKNALMPQMMHFLGACVKAGMNILVSGGTGSGKTTLLNVLSSFIPKDQRITTIEDAAELRLQQEHVARMETRPANLEGKGEVTTRDLIKNALRMRPDRIIVGECRGGEAFDMLQAMMTGHEGSLATIHANHARDALSRLEMLVGMSGMDLPLWFIQKQIASAINIVVQCRRLKGGQRKVVQISEVVGIDNGNYMMHDVMSFEQRGVNDQGNPIGDFRSHGIIPHCLEKLRESGIELPTSYFDGRVFTLERPEINRRQGILT